MCKYPHQIVFLGWHCETERMHFLYQKGFLHYLHDPNTYVGKCLETARSVIKSLETKLGNERQKCARARTLYESELARRIELQSFLTQRVQEARNERLRLGTGCYQIYLTRLWAL